MVTQLATFSICRGNKLLVQFVAEIGPDGQGVCQYNSDKQPQGFWGVSARYGSNIVIGFARRQADIFIKYRKLRRFKIKRS